MRQAAINHVMLNSWKEIASYLDRGVRTVQRWERDLGLPVHRIGKGKRGPVYSTIQELNFWLAASEDGRERTSIQLVPIAKPNGTNHPLRTAQTSRQLLHNVREMVRTLAETSARQYKQAEKLQARMIEIQKLRARLKANE